MLWSWPDCQDRDTRPMLQLFTNGSLSALLASTALLLGACADTPETTPEPISRTPVAEQPALPATPPQPIPDTPSAAQLTFETWRSAFRDQALAKGIDAALFEKSFAGITPDPSIIRADGAQPEFTRPVWEYLDGAISPTRLRRGQALLAEHAATLSAIKQRYGVNRETLVAI